MHDTLIIGGGPAGLQAALSLGRVHRSAVLFDSGKYRNEKARHVHNVLAHDGTPPEELRRLAREQLAEYPTVHLRREAVASVTRHEDGTFTATARDGEASHARTLILATGLEDSLPDIPGLAELWGRDAVHCPFCDGHEYAGRSVAILDDQVHGSLQAEKLRPIVGESHLVTPTDVTRVERTSAGLVLHRTTEAPLEVAAIFVAPRTSQPAPFAEQLGLALTEAGTVLVDALGRTPVDGLFVAGDMAQGEAWPAPLSSVVLATASGQLAAFAIVQDLAMDAVRRL